MTQATATNQASPTAAPPAAPPATPAPPTVVIPGPNGAAQTLAIPATSEQLEQLIQQREEIADQLSNVASRRRDLSAEIRDAPEGASRAGLESRIQILDQRILQLETDLAITGRAIAGAPSDLVGHTRDSNQGGDQFDEGVLAGGFFSLLFAIPVVLYFARRRWKKGTAANRSDRGELAGESTQRLERLEQGMESIAIEIERVSEGQRFVTKLLSEAAEPVSVAHRGNPAKTETRQS